MKGDNIRVKQANPVKLSSTLDILVKELGIAPDIYFEKLKKNWQQIVGVTNTRNTRPVSLKNGLLTITVSSPAWITQARFYKSIFIKKIKDFEPQNNVEIKDIKFKLEK